MQDRRRSPSELALEELLLPGGSDVGARAQPTKDVKNVHRHISGDREVRGAKVSDLTVTFLPDHIIVRDVPRWDDDVWIECRQLSTLAAAKRNDDTYGRVRGNLDVEPRQEQQILREGPDG